MKFRALLNRSLDALAQPRITVRGRALSAFKLCGGAGLVCAVALGLSLAAEKGLRLWVVALLVLSSALTFFALAMATKIVANGERLVYYHQEVAVITSAGLLLWLLRQPVLPYLDAQALCVGVFLSCGRVGCLMVGCCHGRPHRWGVRYGAGHAEAGFTHYYVGVRLFPVQAIESLWALCVVVVGCVMVVSGRPAGSALAWYVVAYDAGRFCFEFMRGDAGRPYLRGFSEAQWTSASLTALVVVAELRGLLPLRPWHLGVAASTAFAMAGVAAFRKYRRPRKHELLHPHHVRELAEAFETLSGPGEASRDGRAEIRVCRTSRGVLISAGVGVEASTRHYSLSCQNEVMDEATARILAELICLLGHGPVSGELFRGRRAVFHLLLRQQQAA